MEMNVFTHLHYEFVNQTTVVKVDAVQAFFIYKWTIKAV